MTYSDGAIVFGKKIQQEERDNIELVQHQVFIGGLVILEVIILLECG